MNILDIAIAKKLAGGGGGSGTDNYNDLSNLPKINDTTLSGNKSSSALGLQSEINSDSKLSSDLVDDENKTNKFVTSTEKQTWNSKQNAIDADHKINADYVDDSTSTNKFVTADNKETWNAKQNAIDSSHKLSSDLVDDANHTNKFVTSTEKQTWNNKQNAIDSYHKLSSSLVSFTTAEAAALASGIDSSKVGQISTNQTNILLVEKSNPMSNELHYNVEDLKKINSGDYSWSDNVASLSGIKFTINEDSSISWVATNLANTVWLKLYDSTEMPAIASGEYVLHGCPSGGGISTYELEAVVGGSDKKEYGDSTSFTVSNNLTLVAIGIRAGTSSGTFYPVLINKSLYDAGLTGWIQPALPNYDLTRLESEDRASLAEVVDSGAKNLLDFASATIAAQPNATATKSSDNLVASCTTGWAYVSLSVGKFTGNCTLSFKISELSNTGASPNIRIGKNQDGSSPAANISFTANGTYSGNFVGDGSNYYLIVYLNPSGTAQTVSLKISEVMVCTKAAFCLSPKFVPYRPDYQALVDKTTEQTFGIFKYNNNYSITAITRKCNGFAWFTLTVTSTANIAANTNTIIGYVDSNVQPVGASTDRIIFTARVNTDTPTLVHSHIRGSDGYIYINSPTAISAGTSISITGSYKY